MRFRLWEKFLRISFFEFQNSFSFFSKSHSVLMAILCSLMKLTQPFQSESSLICILKELGAGVIIPTFHVHDKIALPSILVFFSFLIFQIFRATKIILFVYRRAANTRAHSMVTTLKWIVTVLISLGLLFFLENFVTNVDLELCFYSSTHTTYMICVSFWMKKNVDLFMHIEMYPNKYLLYNAHETYNSIEITFHLLAFSSYFWIRCTACMSPFAFRFKMNVVHI